MVSTREVEDTVLDWAIGEAIYDRIGENKVSFHASPQALK